MAFFKCVAIVPYVFVVLPTLVVAQGWRGIVPMKSNCEDVKKVLGVGTCAPLTGSVFESDDERVEITFTKQLCHWAYGKYWHVPVGTVLLIERRLKKRIPLAEFKVNENKCEKVRTDWLDEVIYSCDEGSVEYDTINGKVAYIYYKPMMDAASECSITHSKPPRKRARRKLEAAYSKRFQHARR
jgi:hypothetical protein